MPQQEPGASGFGRAFLRWQLEANPKLLQQANSDQQRQFRDLKPADRRRPRARDLNGQLLTNTEDGLGLGSVSGLGAVGVSSFAALAAAGRQPAPPQRAALACGSRAAAANATAQAAAHAGLPSVYGPPPQAPPQLTGQQLQQSFAAGRRQCIGGLGGGSGSGALGPLAVAGGQVVAPMPPSWQQLGLARGPLAAGVGLLGGFDVAAENEALRRRVRAPSCCCFKKNVRVRLHTSECTETCQEGLLTTRNTLHFK